MIEHGTGLRTDKESRERRLAAEERDRLLELADELMLIVGTDGFLRRVSAACTRVLGWSSDELLSRPCVDFVHPEDRPALLAASFRVAAGERLTVQGRVQCKTGAWRTVSWSASPVNPAAGTVCAVGRDLTREQELTEHLERIIDQRTRAEERLLASLEEKAVLLREIHHRVKNNLSVIASQLYLQSTYATDAATIQMLHEMRDRVRSMALVHETLYESDSLASIDVAGYVRALTDHLLRSYRSPLIRVTLELDIAPVELNVEAAIPCGLILTELITNSLKHAFQPGNAGWMRVSLLVEESGRLRFEVTDNGVGMPDDIDVSTTRSLGLRLVRSLVAQLDGEFEIRPGAPGTCVRLSFAAPACPERHGDDR